MRACGVVTVDAPLFSFFSPLRRAWLGAGTGVGIIIYTCPVGLGQLLNTMDTATKGMTNSGAFGGVPVRYSLTPLSGWPDERVADTIAVMTRYAVEDAKSPLIAEDAQEAVALGGGDPVLGVWKLCKQRFKFRQDYEAAEDTELPQALKDSIVEVVIRPVDLSLMYRNSLQPVEDCDGYSTYAAALLLSLGIPCSFCTVAVDDRQPGEYSHVYLVTYVSGERMAIDASHGKFCGWEAPNPFGKRREWPVVGAALDLVTIALGAVAAMAIIELMKGRRLL